MRKKVTYEVTLRQRTMKANATDEEIARAVQKEADQLYWQSSVKCETKIISIEALDEYNKKVVYEVTLTKKKMLNTDTNEEIVRNVQKDADMHYWQTTETCETSVLEIEDME